MTAGEERDLLAGAARLGVALDAQAVGRIERFLDLLTIWNRRVRLTGDRDTRMLVRRHVVDSLAIVPELPDSGLLVDLGSGAGFPGIVLGCARPDLTLRLIEPRRRARSFLAEAIRTIPLPEAAALEIRGEDAARDATIGGRSRVVVSRALRLDVLVPLAVPLLARDGRIVAMQTPSIGEAEVAPMMHTFDLQIARVRDYRLPGGESRRLFVLEKIVEQR